MIPSALNSIVIQDIYVSINTLVSATMRKANPTTPNLPSGDYRRFYCCFTWALIPTITTGGGGGHSTNIPLRAREVPPRYWKRGGGERNVRT